MNICIFEDFSVSQLHPINHLRHTSEIICGAVTLKQKAINYFKPKKVTLFTRNFLVPHLKAKYPKYKINEFPTGDCIYINSRVILDRRLADKIASRKKSAMWVKDENLIAIKAKSDIVWNVNNIFSSRATRLTDFRDLNIDIIDIGNENSIINNPSDLILFLNEELKNDLNNIFKVRRFHYPKNRKLIQGASFDTTTGKIYIGEGTRIEPFCYIKGPVYIGNNCTIKSGASIYGPVTIGDFCKVSGEITHSVIHSYVNKQHLGFLGHSYLCEWVNLGAGTNTSNLKNNYSKIHLTIDGKDVDTNSIFLGSIIGDHTKTGINTMLNTGSLIGVSCNLFGSGYHNKSIRSFTWEDASGVSTPYQYGKALAAARISMKRRKVEMADEYEKMFAFVHDYSGKAEI